MGFSRQEYWNGFLCPPPGDLLNLGIEPVFPSTETEDIKKRQQEYTEELHKKDLHDPDNHNTVITHLEPDILDAKSNGL